MLPSLTALGGGIELHGRTLMERIARLRPQARLMAVTRAEARMARPERISVELSARLELSGPASPTRSGFIAHVLAAAARLRPSLISVEHLHHAALGLLAARLTGARLLVWAHGVEAWAVRGRGARLSLGQADRVVAVSQYTARSLADQALVRPERLQVIANAIDVDRFARDDAAQANIEATLLARVGALPRPRLLTVARLDSRERYKGVDRVIEALAAAGLDASYLIVGEGDDRPRLEALARARGVRAGFFGAASDGELPALYRACDLFVMPSTGEGFGYVFVEALCAGLPVIAAKGDGSGEALGGGALGALVDLGEPGALARAIAGHLDGAAPAPPVEEAKRRYGLPRLDDDLSRLLDGLAR